MSSWKLSLEQQVESTQQTESRGRWGKRNTAQRGSQLWETGLSQGKAPQWDPTRGPAGLAAPSQMSGREIGCHTTALS